MSESVLNLQDINVRLSGRHVLHDVTVSLPSRCLVALVGPNGAGKTSLLRAIAGLLPFDGSVRLAGRDISDLSLRARAKQCAYLPQGHIIHWRLPVRDVVALGRYPHGATDPARLNAGDRNAVLRAMAAADIAGLADRDVTELSGGERSRVALARVLAVEAPVVLADEPIASLDPRYQLDIMALLRRVADEGALVIVVTHDIGLASRFADRAMVLSDGRLVAHGASADVWTDAVLADVFRVAAYRAQHAGESIIMPWRGA